MSNSIGSMNENAHQLPVQRIRCPIWGTLWNPSIFFGQTMDYDELTGELDGIFNPELDEDGFHREWPQERLTKHHGLDFTYIEDFN